MTIIEELVEMKGKFEALAADHAKVAKLAEDWKLAAEQGKAEVAAVVKAKDEQIAKVSGDLKAAQELMEQEQVKAIAADAKAKELEAKLKLAPYGDVSDGAKSVADGGSASTVAPKSHAEMVVELGGTTPEAVAYYRKHEKEINAELKSAK